MNLELNIALQGLYRHHELIKEQNNEGNQTAKTLINHYDIFKKSTDIGSIAMFICAYEDWKKDNLSMFEELNKNNITLSL